MGGPVKKPEHKFHWVIAYALLLVVGRVTPTINHSGFFSMKSSAERSTWQLKANRPSNFPIVWIYLDACTREIKFIFHLVHFVLNRYRMHLNQFLQSIKTVFSVFLWYKVGHWIKLHDTDTFHTGTSRLIPVRWTRWTSGISLTCGQSFNES